MEGYKITRSKGVDTITDKANKLKVMAYAGPSVHFTPDPMEARVYASYSLGTIIFETSGLTADNAIAIPAAITWYTIQKNITGARLSLTDPRELAN